MPHSSASRQHPRPIASHHHDDTPSTRGPPVNTVSLKDSQGVGYVHPNVAPVVEAVRQKRNTSTGKKLIPTEEGYQRGESSTWTPETIHDDVCALISAPIPSPRQTGALCFYEDPDSCHIKIGYTMDSPAKRFSTIKKRSKRDQLNKATRQFITGIPYLQLLRLEKLVHADLARYQRDLHIHIRTTNKWTTEREWFAVDIDHARKTANFWLNFIRKNRIEPGTEISDEMRDALLPSDCAGDAAKVVTGQANAKDAWQAVHDSGEVRLLFWKKLLPMSRHQGRALLWAVGCVVAAVVPQILAIPSWLAAALSVSLLVAWTIDCCLR
ncbi:hypothetical protein LTR27_010151 [Elasticomyces elasticus]|nr:hypothetical protein LTR27_010151 [Elasticomyces elasticus]